MSACDDFINSIAKRLKPLSTASELIELGIYRNAQSLALARRKKQGPECFRIGKYRYMYPKEGIIEFLKKSTCI